MARQSGKKYLSVIISGSRTREESEQVFLEKYAVAPVEVDKDGEGFVFYYEDVDGVVFDGGVSRGAKVSARASYSMEFSKYSDAPNNVVEAIIKKNA
ncbi:hypothetical protein [Pseudomonas moraviensis]|uniref:Uncharacterized protein n=1 Tax=Pseudomonas moraviensis TaxID=321662 RepID=A0A7Y9W144_9PSED|nr:hypothetical protein [Pseudomonas moraviensis]NYH12311.1 hypothetical protein [Pseudomonas moraviensis]